MRIQPTDRLSGALDNSSCQLSDATAYTAYRLNIPSHGQLQIDLSTDANFAAVLQAASGARLDSGKSIRRPIEAGSYTLLVNAVAPGQVGTYSVATSFTPEPGMMCTNFPALGLSQTVSGTLGVSGCMTPDSTPYEAWWLTTMGSGTLTVAASSGDFTPTVTIRSHDGYAIASSSGQVSVPVDAATQYQIVLSTADQPGTYQVVTSFQPADGETCRAAASMSDSSTDNSTVGPGSCFLVTPDSGDLSYFNYYNLTVATPGIATLSATSKDFIPTLNLLDDAGNLVAVDSGGGGAPGQAQILQQLTPGNYTVQVFSSLASGGAYTMGYQFTPGGPTPCSIANASPGNSIAAALSPASCRSAVGLADLYNFTLPAAGTFTLDLTTSSFSSLLALRDTKDNLIVLDEDVQGLGISHLAADLPAGTYTVAAAATSGSGAYQLATQFAAHDVPACGYVPALDINGGYIQKLGPGSCRGADGQPVDLYQFTLPADAVVAAIMTSSDVDSFLTLTDASGNTLRSDDNSYGYDGSLIVQFLPAGTYQLAAHAATYTPGGYYEVDVRNAQGSRPPFCASLGKLALGGSVSGAISFASCQYPDSTFADLYQITLANPTTIDLRLNSTAFDAQLMLLDAKGNLVDQDDDSGGGTNSRVVRSLPAGTYFAVAKPLGDYTAAGAYTLSLAQSQ